MLLHLPNLRLPPFPGVAVLLALSAFCAAQEPSSSLKQADADYRAGVAALSRNDLRAARGDFENVVRLAPAAEQGHSALGAVLIRTGEPAAGIRELEKALAMHPGDASAQQNLALAYEQIGHAARALPWFAKVEANARAQKLPLSPEFLAAYARSLAAAHQLSAAAATMKQAMAKAPQNAEFADELGSIYAQEQDWPNAQQAFHTALQINPQMAMVHFHLGMTFEAQQQPGAAAELKQAYALAPGNAAIAFSYAQSLTRSGDDRDAIPVLERALQLDPSSNDAAYQLGLALQRSNRVHEAIPLLRKAAAADAGNADVLTNLGMALCQAQQAKDAVPLLQRAVALAPHNPTAHQNLAAAYIQLSQFGDAVRELRAALQLAPDAPELHYNLGLAFKMQDDAADAIPEFQAAEKLQPSAPEPPYALGLLYLQAGHYADAQRELKASLRLQPQNGDGWATLGSIDSHLDQLPEAASALREAIRQRPDQPDAHLTLAAVLVKQNQPAEAAAERRHAADLMRANMNRQRAEVASNSGNDLLQNGKVGDAIVEFRDALSFDPACSKAHMGLANALQQQGKVAEAAAERQKAEALEKDAAAGQDHR